MAKPGRNDRCPCGSGKKYKACCLTGDEAAELDGLAEAQAQREMRARFIAKMQRAEEYGTYDDDLNDASNAVLDMVNAGNLDEAEAAARALLARYPEVHDGWDRLGMVHEARGNAREAADCYRRVLGFLAQHPGYADDELEATYRDLVAKLDPPAAG